jgi:hypothetical protein
MTHRSAAVAIAVTIGLLAGGQRSGWTEDQELVLDALRRSTGSLHDAPEAELADYLVNLSPEQMRGVVSNVKGIFHEMLVARAENTDGDEVSANLFDAINHPGADIEFVMDGNVIREVQLKAVQTQAAIIEHFDRYPTTDVLATSEVTALLAGAFGHRVMDSGFNNATITDETRATFEALADEDLGDFIQDGLLTSTLLGGALAARAIIISRRPTETELKSLLEVAGVGLGTTFAVQAMLDLI